MRPGDGPRAGRKSRSNAPRGKKGNEMSEYYFLVGKGHLGKRAAKIAAKHGATLVNHTDPGCGCGYGCTSDCWANRRHWFACDNLGEPFNSATAREVESDLRQSGIDIGDVAAEMDSKWTSGSRHVQATRRL